MQKSKPIVYFEDYAYRLPYEGYQAHLVGVHDHPLGLEGELVTTSIVVKVISDDEFETLNTHYKRIKPKVSK